MPRFLKYILCIYVRVNGYDYSVLYYSVLVMLHVDKYFRFMAG
jgi:hypothetical protein